MAAQQITQGALEAIIYDPARAEREYPVPVLQCLQIKSLGSKGEVQGAERYRVVLSDIRNYVQCMLATQANAAVHEGLLQLGSIVRLRQYLTQVLKGRNILIILNLEVISALGNPARIGDPKSLESRDAQPGSTTIGGSGFYGAKDEPTEDVKPPARKQEVVRSAPEKYGASTIYPIEALSLYSNKWTIKARVTMKTPIKTWAKASNDGKLFSVNLLDESGEIRATGFNDQVDQFYDLLQEGSVYYISTPCRVGFAKKQFSNLPNDYELTFERDTVIEKAEDQSSVPQVRFNFCSIQELQNVAKDATIDVIGVLKDVQEAQQIVSKTTQKPYDKRDLSLVDDTGYQVRVTIWGKAATEFDGSPESVIAFKGTRVNEYNGSKSLSLLSSGTMVIDPDIPEAHKLKGWYDSQGRNGSFTTHSNLASAGAAGGRQDEIKTIAQVNEEQLGMGDQAAYFLLKGTVQSIKHDPFAYPACLNETCNKKVTKMGDDTWLCENCQQHHDRPRHRYILSVNITDHTGHLWVTCFDEAGQTILGRTADEVAEMQNEGEARLHSAFQPGLCRKFTFRVRAKMETYANIQRPRYQVMGIWQLDYKQEAHRLADLIKQMSV
ncbi:hypothetical protein VTK26DRAFT_7066 [Humicola hyalothermophila]